MARKTYLVCIIFIFAIPLIPLGYLIWALTFWFDKRGLFAQFYSRMWAFILTSLNPLWKVKIEGLENVDKSKRYIIISNHGSMFDIPLMYHIPLNFRWVSKREVLKIPVAGWVLWLQHGITIKRGTTQSAKQMLVDGEKLIARGLSIAVFPEGTRTKTGRVNKFMPGAFMLASRCGVPILPVVLCGSYELLGDGKFGRVFTLKVLPEISAAEVSSMKLSALAEKMNELIEKEHAELAPQYYDANGK